MKDRISETCIGVLGAGRMGLVHCSLIEETPGLRLLAASSRATVQLEKARERFGIKTYDRHEKLLADPEIQWVVISTTTENHKEWALKALEAGKEIIVEKPIALNLGETEEILKEAEKRKLRVTVHLNRRWDLDFKLIRKVIGEGSIGEVYRIESGKTDYSAGWAGWGAQGMENPWRIKKRYGGGFLNDWGTHLIDQLLLLKREKVKTVFGRMEGRVWTKEVDDHFWAEILFSDGTTARVEASNNFRIPMPRWFLIGVNGTLKIKGGDPTEWDRATIKKEWDEIDEEVTLSIPHGEISRGFYSAFAEALRKDKPLPVTPGEILEVMRVVDAIRKSAESGNSVSL